MIPQIWMRENEEVRQAGGAADEEEAAWSAASQQLLKLMLGKVNRVLLGKPDVVKLTFAALLAGGHVLLEDVPGVGKTQLARAIARVMGGQFRRIQFTADMLPADVSGGMMWDAGRGELVFRPGPLMANIVLADEINRTPPRTQSALLEAMEERSVTADGETMLLPLPFMLLATQNPLRDEGTYPLPEAQLDRFIMRLSIGYPAPEYEVQMLSNAGEERKPVHPDQLRPIIIPEEWLRMQRDVGRIYINERLLEYAVNVVCATRTAAELELGASPRATRDWIKAAKAMAYLDGRDYVVPDDLKGTAEAVLIHRLLMRDEALLDGAAPTGLLRKLLTQTALTAEG
ncbi:AAA family ATPase [Paenibacillus sp. GCM10027626]|uniref:AAA family ATPase n=1 Tax=Paenibacillus sp. GCM10027626 TaxID=3273411 RepID=UPI003636919A